jgi:hypothetical protein
VIKNRTFFFTSYEGLRQAQHTGHVFLSNDNLATLNDELLQNY